MTDEQRQICRAVIESYEALAPVERRARTTDLLLMAAAVASMSVFVVAAYGVTGWWAVAYVLLAAALGFFYRGLVDGIFNRRRAFRAISEVHELAELELKLDD